MCIPFVGSLPFSLSLSFSPFPPLSLYPPQSPLPPSLPPSLLLTFPPSLPAPHLPFEIDENLRCNTLYCLDNVYEAITPNTLFLPLSLGSH